MQKDTLTEFFNYRFKRQKLPRRKLKIKRPSNISRYFFKNIQFFRKKLFITFNRNIGPKVHSFFKLFPKFQLLYKKLENDGVLLSYATLAKKGVY
jgi:hypothetical protein